MRSQDFIRKCRAYGVQVFTSTVAMKILGKDTKYASLYLSRLVKAKALLRIERGKYCIANSDIYAISSNIVFPSYVSMLSAFRYYSITSQNVVRIDVMTPRRHKPITDINGYSIQFIKTDRKCMFGFHRIRDSGAFMAYIEKALIDAALYGIPKPYIMEAVANAASIKMLDYQRFQDFLSMLGNNADIAWLEDAVKGSMKNAGAIYNGNI